MENRKRSDLRVMLSTLHLLLAVGAMIWCLLNLPSSLAGTWMGVILASLFIWPIVWGAEWVREERRRKEEEGSLGG